MQDPRQRLTPAEPSTAEFAIYMNKHLQLVDYKEHKEE